MNKRLFDIALVSITAPLWLPLLAFVAILVRVKLGKPVFFRQFRPGRSERVFEMVKFRTMRDLRDGSGNLLPDAARITKFGMCLRSSSLDELPELLNVFRGEMSLVGPRPLLIKYLPLYSVEQKRRHLLPPGITGWAQINGRNCIRWEDRFKLDLWYIENQTLLLDAKILWKTIWKVLQRNDVTAAGHVTMPEFRGTQDELRT
jgi:sugar transferase EpsL